MKAARASYAFLTLVLLISTVYTQDYCATAPSSIYTPPYTIAYSTPSVIPPIPCNGIYAIQEGYCCSNGFSCPGDGTCSCSNGTLIYSLPLAPCVTQNPYYSGCPGSMLAGLCCSGPGIFMQGPYNATWSTAVCNHGTAIYNITTATDGAIGTTTLPPGISYTQTRCFTCPLYTRTSSAAAAVRTAKPEDAILGKIAAVGALLVAI